MKYFSSFIIILFVISFSFVSHAEINKVDLFSPRKQTPNMVIPDILSKPDKFEKSNNLARKAGSFEVAIGEPLYIKGTVSDAFGARRTDRSDQGTAWPDINLIWN